MRKTNKLLGLLISLGMLLSTVPTMVSAADAGTSFAAGDFNYKVNTDTTTVTLTSIAATKLSGAVTVPQTVSDGTSTYTVTQLGDAFKNQGTKTAEMTSLVLPDTITKFTGTAQFYGCKFTSIHLPANLTGDATGTGFLTNSFMFCSNLKSVELPVGITKCYGTFRDSPVRTVTIKGTASVDFYAGSGTTAARAWSDGVTGITIYYPYNGTAPTRITGSFTATAATYGNPTFTAGDFTYTVNDTNTVTLTAIAAEKLTGAVTVPQTVSDGVNTYTVTKLGDAFKNQGTKTAEMTSLVLPDTITKFTGTATFYACKGLTSIKLPANLTGDATAGQLTSTFMFCTKLTSVDLPAGIKQCYGTFRDSTVRTVTTTGTIAVSFYADSATAGARAWSDGVTGITIYYPYGGTAPTRWNGTYFTANAVVKMPTYVVGDFNYKLNSDGQTVTLTSVAAENLAGAVTVPSTITVEDATYTVTGIGAQAFNGETAITSLTLPNTITAIGYQAFLGMTGLTSFEMPDSVTTIDYGTFYACSNLESVKLSKNLTGTMQTTFAYCSKLNGCVIPDGVTTLNRTFMYCNIISAVYVPASVTTITGDKTDIRERLFSTFDTEGVITGAPTERSFVVFGTAGSAIETYMAEKDWNFRVVNADMALELGTPSPAEDDFLATVNVVNCKETDVAEDLVVYCAYYDKTNDQLVRVGKFDLDGVNAVTVGKVIIPMPGAYDASAVYARAFVWENGTLAPFADFTELFETVTID